MEGNNIETPYFLIKEDLLNQNVSDFQNALRELWPNSIIGYSVKTNSLPWILNWMNAHGIYAEVVSDEEYQLALLSGIPSTNIIFNGPIKSELYLRKALEDGAIINVDSSHEIDFIKNNISNLSNNFGIRINVDPSIFSSDDVGYQEDGFRFGFSEENGEFQKALNKIECINNGVHIGLHMHVNSITRSVKVYHSIAKYAAFIIKKYNIRPTYIDIGGGFFGGVPGKATPLEYIESIKSELENIIDIEQTKLIIEPGSAIIGSTIELHTSVLDVKDTSRGRIVTTDGSRVYIDPLWNKKSYLYTIDSINDKFSKQIICGYTCMDHDRIMSIEDEPELKVGDHIVYHRVGNYTVTFGGPFIKPIPPVYSLNNNDIKLVRKKMTVEDYFRMETV